MGPITCGGGGIRARCLQKLSFVGGSPSKTGVPAGGASPSKPTHEGRKDLPIQANAGDGLGGGDEPICADQVDAGVIRVRLSGGDRNVLFSGRDGKSGEEVGVGGMRVGNCKPKGTPSSAECADLMEALVVGVNRKNTLNKYRLRRQMLHTTHPASSSIGWVG